jgi:hypothetical protein
VRPQDAGGALPIELHEPIARLAFEQLGLGYRAVIMPPGA